MRLRPFEDWLIVKNKKRRQVGCRETYIYTWQGVGEQKNITVLKLPRLCLLVLLEKVRCRSLGCVDGKMTGILYS